MERYVLQTDVDEFETYFGVKPASSEIIKPNYNASSGHALPVVWGDKTRSVELAKWNTNRPTVNITEHTFGQIFGKVLQPCIIPVTGFYMWKKTVNDPLPFFVRIHSRKLLAIAGVIDTVKSRNSFQVLTREASVLLKPLDEEMPCILEPAEIDDWLNGNEQQVLAKGFSHNLFMPDMTVFRVPDLVNDISNNSPDLIQPIPKLREED